MEKLPMCRICLVENVRMYVVVNRSLHELYEKLTDIPFVTEDRRPIFACFICCTKLKQCYRLLRKCLEAEEQFTRMMKEDYEPKPLINQDRLEFYSGFIKSPIENISIVDECQTESITIKEELPAVCEGLDDIIEPKEEHQSDELESENVDYSSSCLDTDIPPQHSESDLEDDVPLMEFKIEVEEEEVSQKAGQVRETKKLEPKNLDSTCLDVADLPRHYSESDFGYDVPLIEFNTDVEEEVSNTQRVRLMKRATLAKKTKLDARRINLEDAITAEQQKKEHSVSKVIRTTLKRSSRPGTYCKKSYKCNKTNHIGIHTGEKPYKCDVCQRSFSRNNNLKKHILIHTGEKPYKCDVCQRSFTQKSGLTNHIGTHTGAKPYKCNVCQRSFSLNNNLTKHILIHTGEKPYKCDVCQRSFSRNNYLTKHIRIHTGQNVYKCDVCQRSFTQKSSLTNHIGIHTGVKPYKCNVCQRSFSLNNDLTKHILIHTGENPFKCDVCQRSFTEKSHLTKHVRIHTGEHPYKCDVCQRSFTQNSSLKTHIRIHTGENPYKCDVCQRSFTQNSSLIKHIRIHTGEKPYKCDICPRSFSQKSNLTNHVRLHIGEKSYKCRV